MKILVAAICLIAGIVFSAGVSSQSSNGDFVLIKSTIDGGGGTSSSAGGEFTLTGTIGQHDASTQVSSGGDFALAGGFWASIGETLDLIFENGFESD